MPVRHTLLAVAAVLVTGMCVYLFFQVRSSPAAPQPPSATANEDVEPDAKSGDEPGPKVAGAGLRGIARTANGGEDKSPETPASSIPPTEPVVEGKLQGPKLDALMAEANKAYDKMDLEEARSIAQKVLKQQPANTRMLRIMTSSYCIEVDAGEAQKWFNMLPAPDREQMKTRCTRYGVTFTDPPAK